MWKGGGDKISSILLNRKSCITTTVRFIHVAMILCLPEQAMDGCLLGLGLVVEVLNFHV